MVGVAGVLIVIACFFIAGSLMGCAAEMNSRDGPALVQYLWFFFSVLFLVLSCIFLALARINEKIEDLIPRLPPRKPPRAPPKKQAKR